MAGRALALGGGEVVEVRAFGVIELEGAAERVEDFFGGAGELAAFQADVVVDADTGEQGDFLAAQAGDPALAVAEGGQAGLPGVILARRVARNSRISRVVSMLSRLGGAGFGWEVLPVPGTAEPSARL